MRHEIATMLDYIEHRHPYAEIERDKITQNDTLGIVVSLTVVDCHIPVISCRDQTCIADSTIIAICIWRIAMGDPILQYVGNIVDMGYPI